MSTLVGVSILMVIAVVALMVNQDEGVRPLLAMVAGVAILVWLVILLAELVG